MPVGIAAQPQHQTIVTHDVESDMQPCIYGALGENEAGTALMEGCGGQCAKEATRIVDGVRQYLAGTLIARQTGLALGAVGGAFLLFVAVRKAEKRRILASRKLSLIRAAACLVVFVAAAGYAWWGESRVAPGLISADSDLRTMYRLGVLPRAGTANAHCAVQLLRVAASSDSAAAKIVAEYPGLFTEFASLQVSVGSSLTRTELQSRIDDMTRALEGHAVDQKASPSSVSAVFDANQIFARARTAWDPLGFLRLWWLAPVIAAALAFALHWVALWVFDLAVRREVTRIIATRHS